MPNVEFELFGKSWIESQSEMVENSPHGVSQEERPHSPIADYKLNPKVWSSRGTSLSYPRSETVRKIIIFPEALPRAPLNSSIVLHFLPALDPLPMSDNLEVVF